MAERLCFGTFINVLAQCKAARVNKGRFTNTIIQTIDPQSRYVTESTKTGKSADKDNSTYRALNHLYKCTGDFSPQYSSVIELALKADREVVTQLFEENVIPLIDEDKSPQAISALFALIKNDTTLKADGGINVKKFQDCIKNRAIEDFLSGADYDLPEILASIFLYTVTAVKNTEGKDWLKEISTKYKNYEVFFAEYINSFGSTTSNIEPVANAKSDAEQVRDFFIAAAQQFKVMESINRKPAVLNRADSANLNVFLREIDHLISGRNLDSSLQMPIVSFIRALEIQVLSLDATLNNRFGFDNNSASFNMEVDDSDPAERRRWVSRAELPEWSIELVQTSEDPIGLLRSGISEWGNFRNEMNLLFETICAWRVDEKMGT